VYILVVDDSNGSRKLTAVRLRNLGHRTVEAASAEEAVRRLKEAKFDLLVTDFEMPGKNGVELINLAIEKGYVKQAILCSLHPMETICKTCAGLGVRTDRVTHYLSKHDRNADGLKRTIAEIENDNG
jgi:CheY-like chemotaxis protein